MSTQPYRGRFAPSPTGPVHLGTLIAAVGSYLQARTQQGEWLLRIEDVDITRSLPGAADAILKALDGFGFEWDGEVIYQSQRTELYQAALETLIASQRVYPCICSRKQLAEGTIQGIPDQVYPGRCRERRLPLAQDHALRITVPQTSITFEDAVMGRYSQQLASECGDFVIRRRDGLFAYQLAVVVDDALQGITEVVRGVDLLDSTPRQIYLQQQLAYAQPAYLHLPLVLDEHNMKLGKSTGGAALDVSRPQHGLLTALRHLGQQPPAELVQADKITLWQWAIEHWDIDAIPEYNRHLHQI